jgi:HSP20 family molecular chaperone IbpA
MSLASAVMDMLTRHMNNNRQEERGRQPADADVETSRERERERERESYTEREVQGHRTVTDDNSNINDGEPRLDVLSNSSEYVIFVDVPGVSREHLNIEIQGRSLCVSGQRALPVVRPPFVTCISERPAFPRFSRSILMHPDADMNGIEAHYLDGLLCLRVRRTPGFFDTRRGVGLSSLRLPVRYQPPLGGRVSSTSHTHHEQTLPSQNPPPPPFPRSLSSLTSWPLANSNANANANANENENASLSVSRDVYNQILSEETSASSSAASSSSLSSFRRGRGRGNGRGRGRGRGRIGRGRNHDQPESSSPAGS